MSVENKTRFGVETFATGSQGPIATLAGRPLVSNRGNPLNLDWVQQVRSNAGRKATPQGAL
jgi:hypothetical protein